MNNSLMFSSETDLWSTPQAFFDKINAVFHFTLDVCATNENAKCDLFICPEIDALKSYWNGVCWMNPPYGREINLWVKKAYESAKQNGATVVCLLPARTDTKWWHDYCAKGEVLLLKGRLKFGEATNSAPFPSALVIFRPSLHDLEVDGMFA